MSQISSQTLLELGESLQSSLRALVSKDGELPRPTDLARVWSLDQTLCVRTCAALRNDEPLRVLHQLPSSGGLRSIVEAGEGQGVPRKIREAAAAAVDRLDAVIRSLGGRKTNLDTLIGVNLVEARQKIEASSKQGVYRGLSTLYGTSTRVALTTYFIQPSSTDSETLDAVALYGSVEMRRIRPDRSLLLGGRLLCGESAEISEEELDRRVEIAERNLLSEELPGDGSSIALREFCSDPLPPLQLERAGRKLLYTLPADPDGMSQISTVLFLSRDGGVGPTRIPEGGPRNFVFVPRTPSEHMLLEVLVDEAVWSGCEPQVEISRGDVLLRPLSEQSAADRLDFCESARSLGEESPGWDFAEVPRYREMLGAAARIAGLDLGRYRLFRLHVRYPVISLAYQLQLIVPPSSD